MKEVVKKLAARAHLWSFLAMCVLLALEVPTTIVLYAMGFADGVVMLVGYSMINIGYLIFLFFVIPHLIKLRGATTTIEE